MLGNTVIQRVDSTGRGKTNEKRTIVWSSNIFWIWENFLHCLENSKGTHLFKGHFFCLPTLPWQAKSHVGLLWAILNDICARNGEQAKLLQEYEGGCWQGCFCLDSFITPSSLADFQVCTFPGTFWKWAPRSPWKLNKMEPVSSWASQVTQW